MLQKLLDELCTELNILPIPQVDPQLGAILPFRKDTSIEMQELKPGVSFFSPIGPYPMQRREELLVNLSKANYLGQMTGPCRIGMSSDEKFLTLSLGMPYELTYRGFREALEDFVNFLLYWREQIEQFDNQLTLL